ncbi:MAG: alkaline phosphatase D family protein [Gemmatimonadetes bacterium]|nr:alkaline phosphatase D family protein [Gemmatimonadota bacterium]
MDRRLFLADLTKYAALCATVPNIWRVTSRPRFADDPFTLGVASGDPTPNGGVLWTRLAPRPLEPEGGMESRTAVDWEVAEDDAFTKIVQKGRAAAVPELSYSVHVDVTGLAPDRWYVYRFRAAGASSPVGRFRTAPADGARVPLHMAFMSCQRWDQGLFTALGHLAREEQLDLAVHLGDYIYEGGSPASAVRKHVGLEIRTVDDYRRRYAQYKTDPLLQAAHARCPWLVVWDDHEVDNNYAGARGENGMESVEQMRARRAAGYQAWWEHQPVRVPRAQSWADLTITRSVSWGALARLWMLDSRQYRDVQACGGASSALCDEATDPRRGLLGSAQEQWLVDGLGASRSRWQVLANQVMMAPYDSAAGAELRVSMDQWSGYPVARDRLLGAIAKRAPNRTVVITGDIHSSWVNELHSDFARPDRPVIGAEFVGTSLSSGGDGGETPATRLDAMRKENPHLRWFQNRRGYVRCRVDEQTWTTDYRSVPFVEKPDAPIVTASSWRLEHGRPGITKV